jgi:hypothetical protein
VSKAGSVRSMSAPHLPRIEDDLTMRIEVVNEFGRSPLEST